MKIGFNVKKIKNLIMDTISFYDEITVQPNISQLSQRVFQLETNTSNEWIEITSDNGQEAEITQEFTEIKMQARGTGTLYSVTCNYDSIIFHNSSSDAPTYIIAGNPIENNYGCKFKYMKQPITEKQYVCVDSCFSGGSQDVIEFRAWIKPKPTGTQ